MPLSTQVFGVIFSDGSDDGVTVRPELTGNAGVKETITLGTGTVTDQQEDIGFQAAGIKGILITVDANPATTVVVKTNSTSAPDNTFTFPIGGGELFWTSRSPVACPVTVTVTKLYLTKTGVDTPTVKIRVLLNP